MVGRRTRIAAARERPAGARLGLLKGTGVVRRTRPSPLSEAETGAEMARYGGVVGEQRRLRDVISAFEAGTER